MTSKVQGNPSLEVYFRKKWPKKHVLITRNTSQRCRTRKSARPIKKMSQTWSKKAQKIDFFRWNRSLFSPRKPTIWGSITAKSDRKGDARSRTTHPGGLNPQNLAENRKNPLKKHQKITEKNIFLNKNEHFFASFPITQRSTTAKTDQKNNALLPSTHIVGRNQQNLGENSKNPWKNDQKITKKSPKKTFFWPKKKDFSPECSVA